MQQLPLRSQCETQGDEGGLVAVTLACLSNFSPRTAIRSGIVFTNGQLGCQVNSGTVTVVAVVMSPIFQMRANKKM